MIGGPFIASRDLGFSYGAAKRDRFFPDKGCLERVKIRGKFGSPKKEKI